MAKKITSNTNDSIADMADKKGYLSSLFGKSHYVRYFNEKEDGIQFIPTGILELDNILGGGWVKGKVTLIYGIAGSGKSSILIQSIAHFMKHNPNKQVLYIDSESALNPKYLENMGVDLSRLMVYQTVIAEDTFEVIQKTCLNKVADIIVLDSIASLVAAQDIESNSNIRDNTIASLSRVLSSTFKKLLDVIRESNIAVILTTQCRANIGTYGGGTSPAGGMAVLHISSVLIEMRRDSYIKNTNSQIIGFYTKIKCVKNRFADPHNEIILPLTFGKGLDKDTILFNYLVSEEIITQKGTWFYYGDKSLGQGKENALHAILQDENIYNDLLKRYQNKES